MLTPPLIMRSFDLSIKKKCLSFLTARSPDIKYPLLLRKLIFLLGM